MSRAKVISGLVLVVVLGLASSANAALLISVNSIVDPGGDIWPLPSETCTLDIWGDGQTPPPQEAYLVVQGLGAIDGHTLCYPGDLSGYWDWEDIIFPGPGIPPFPPGEWWEDLGYPGVADLSHMVFAHSSTPAPPLSGTLVDDIIFHCDGIADPGYPGGGPGEVMLTLISGDLTTIFDTQIIHQGEPGPWTYYVNGTCGDDTWNGTNEACTAPDGPKLTIQAAIDVAQPGDTVIIAEGTYTGDGNRDLDFAGKAITVRSTDPYDPVVVAATVIDGQADRDLCLNGLCEQHRGFYFHSGEGLDSVVAGLTITSFCAPDEQLDSGPGSMPAGAGIFCQDSRPTISHCTITSNWAHRWGEGFGGGGIYCEGGSPVITNCTISGNDGYLSGGGVKCSGGNPTISYCTITNNKCSWGGGGIGCGSGATITNSTINDNRGGYGGGIYGSPIISHCTITDNRSFYDGGGICGSPTVSHCSITGNVAYVGYGGGICCSWSGALTITNSTIADNSAESGFAFEQWVDGKGGAIYCNNCSLTISQCTITVNWAEYSGGGIYCKDSSPTVGNSILWGNMPQEIHIESGAPIMTFCDVQDGFCGLGNIAVDPCFADPGNGDYHLKSQAGRWDPAGPSWVLDAVTSRCIDAGNCGCPLGDEPSDLNNTRINMGAHGGTNHASKTPANWSLLADLTNEGVVDLRDFAAQSQYWQLIAAEQPGDLNHNGAVEITDFVLLTQDWLQETIWHE